MLIDQVLIFHTREPGDREPASLREVSHERFRQWAEDYLRRAGIRYQHGRLDTTPDEREAIVKQMIEWNIAPAMMKE